MTKIGAGESVNCCEVEQFDRDTLFVWPKFHRTDFEANVLVTWSPKMKARVYVYTLERIRLWEFMEIDPNIKRYNVAMQPMAVVSISGEAALSIPDGITENMDGELCLHVISRRGSSRQTKRKSELSTASQLIGTENVNWRTCSKQLGAELKIWTLEELGRHTDLRLEMSRLTCFASRRNQIMDTRLSEDIYSTLLGVRLMTLGELLRIHAKRDQDDVLASVAEMVRIGRLFIDLVGAPLSMKTRLSARQESLK